MSNNGNYWSAGAPNQNNASYLNFNSGNVNPLNNNNRANGFSVRLLRFTQIKFKSNNSMTKSALYKKLSQAYLDARKNERNKIVQQRFEIFNVVNLHKLSHEIYTQTWKPSPLISFMIDKPTYREIFAPNFRDEVVSHLLFNLIEPWIEKKFIYDTYSCRKGKGTLFGVNRFIHHIRSETNNYKHKAYVLSLDISGYFMSIDKNILKQILFKHLHKHPEFKTIEYLINITLDRDPLEGCIKIGDLSLWKYLPANKSLFNSPPGVGLIIGDIISQLFSNIYLNELDQFCKRELGCKHYVRYVDDARIISRDRKYLESIIPVIDKFLEEKLHLKLHPRKTKIQSTNDNLSFLGVSIRKYRKHALRRTVNNFKAYVRSIKYNAFNPEEILPHINSYLGYFSHLNDYKTVKKIIDNTWLYRFFEFTFTPGYTKAKITKQMRTLIYSFPPPRSIDLNSGKTRILLNPQPIFRDSEDEKTITMEYEVVYVDILGKPNYDSIYLGLLRQGYTENQEFLIKKNRNKHKEDYKNLISYMKLCETLAKNWINGILK